MAQVKEEEEVKKVSLEKKERRENWGELGSKED